MSVFADVRVAIRSLFRSKGFAAAAALVPTALLASYVPARKAARIDPTIALRRE